MKISLLFPNNWFQEIGGALEKLGHEVFYEALPEIDVIIGGSISQLSRIREAHQKYPKIPMANYHWDLYSWQIENPRMEEYEWESYKTILEESKIVWSPSNVTRRFTKKIWGIESEVIRTFVPVFQARVTSGDHIYQVIRELPDRDWGLVEDVCKELGIKVVTHATPFEEHKRVLASCKAVVSPVYEASTGSLSLVEAAYLGKPCLISDSEWNAGNEYLKGAPTFKNGDREDLAKKLLGEIRFTPNSYDFGIDAMAKKLSDSLNANIH